MVVNNKVDEVNAMLVGRILVVAGLIVDSAIVEVVVFVVSTDSLQSMCKATGKSLKNLISRN